MVKFIKVHENVLYAALTRARFVHGQGARGFVTYEVVWRPRSGRSELAKRARNPRQVIGAPQVQASDHNPRREGTTPGK